MSKHSRVVIIAAALVAFASISLSFLIIYLPKLEPKGDMVMNDDPDTISENLPGHINAGLRTF